MELVIIEEKGNMGIILPVISIINKLNKLIKINKSSNIKKLNLIINEYFTFSIITENLCRFGVGSNSLDSFGISTSHNLCNVNGGLLKYKWLSIYKYEYNI